MATFDPFEKDIRQRAAGLRQSPSPQAWQRLEQQLDQRHSRRRGFTLLGMRPWMIAAMLLLVVGFTALSVFSRQDSGPLAQRAESVEDLDDAFAPADNFDADAYRNTLERLMPSDREELEQGFRDVTVNPKYRS